MDRSQQTLCFSGDGAINVNLFRLFNSINKFDSSVEVIDWDRGKKYKRSAIINNIHYSFILRGWGYKNKGLWIGYINWMVKVFFYALFAKPKRIWASNLQNAFPIAFATIITKTPFIYYIHDNISISYAMPKWVKNFVEMVDNFVIKRAATVLVPDENRILPHAQQFKDKFVVLPNVPLKTDMAVAQNNYHEIFTVFVLGTIWDSRGIDTLLTAVDDSEKIRILVAGNIPQKWVKDRVLSHPSVDYRGALSQEETFRLFDQIDVVFVFYDPSLPICERASPTKLYESMMMGKPVIVNKEIMISKKVLDWDIGYLCGYDDVNGLKSLLSSLSKMRSDLIGKGKKAYALYKTSYNWNIYEQKFWATLKDLS